MGEGYIMSWMSLQRLVEAHGWRARMRSRLCGGERGLFPRLEAPGLNSFHAVKKPWGRDLLTVDSLTVKPF